MVACALAALFDALGSELKEINQSNPRVTTVVLPCLR